MTCFTAGKPTAQAEHKHMEMEIKKLLITTNSEVLGWVYSRICRLKNLAGFELELGYSGLYDRLSIPPYRPSPFRQRFQLPSKGSESPLLWVKTGENDQFSGS